MSEKKIAYKPLIDFQSFEIAERLIAAVYSMEDDGIEIVYPGMKMPSAACVKGDAHRPGAVAAGRRHRGRTW